MAKLYQDDNGYRREKRQQKDKISQAISILAALSWVFSFLTATLLHSAQPSGESIFTRLMDLEVSNAWNSSLLRLAAVSTVLTFIICFFGFCFNTMRHRRETDRYNKSLIIFGILSVIGFIAIIIRFGALF